MKLTTRRTLRQWFLDAPYGTFYGLIGLGAALIGLGIVVEADAVALVGFLGILGVAYLHEESKTDACPTCRSAVDATSRRYCSTCGARLDELEAAPPIDERVDERFRPVGLNEIERSPPVATIADGGEMGEADQDEVRG
jgi:hypothetical protein